METVVASIAPAHSVVSHSNPELDWALIQLDDMTCYHNRVKNPILDHQILRLDHIKTIPPVGEVLLLTSRGILRAKGGGTFSSLRLPHAEDSISVWSIDLGQSLG